MNTLQLLRVMFFLVFFAALCSSPALAQAEQPETLRVSYSSDNDAEAEADESEDEEDSDDGTDDSRPSSLRKPGPGWR